MKIRWKGRRKREGERQAEREGSAGMTRTTTRWSRGPRLIPLLKGTPRPGLQRGPPKPRKAGRNHGKPDLVWLCSETWGSSGEAHVPGGPDAKGLDLTTTRWGKYRHWRGPPTSEAALPSPSPPARKVRGKSPRASSLQMWVLPLFCCEGPVGRERPHPGNSSMVLQKQTRQRGKRKLKAAWQSSKNSPGRQTSVWPKIRHDLTPFYKQLS